jgi:hypothetical protein
MKNLLSVRVLALALCIAASFADIASAQSPYSPKPQFSVKIYSGASVLPYFATGFKDAHITEFPEIPFFSSNEGRLSLPLSQGASSGIRLGGLLGLEVSNLGNYKRLSFNLELQGMPGENSRYFNIAGGFGYKVFNLKEDFNQNIPLTIGVIAKGGYTFGVATLATVAALPERPFTDLVVTDNGVFQVGDRIQSDIFGATLQLAVTANYEIIRNVDVGLQLGYSGAWLNSITATSGSGGTFFADSPNVVNANLTDRVVGFSRAFESAPTISLNGFFASLNIGLTIY